MPIISSSFPVKPSHGQLNRSLVAPAYRPLWNKLTSVFLWPYTPYIRDEINRIELTPSTGASVVNTRWGRALSADGTASGGWKSPGGGVGVPLQYEFIDSISCCYLVNYRTGSDGQGIATSTNAPVQGWSVSRHGLDGGDLKFTKAGVADVRSTTLTMDDGTWYLAAAHSGHQIDGTFWLGNYSDNTISTATTASSANLVAPNSGAAQFRILESRSGGTADGICPLALVWNGKITDAWFELMFADLFAMFRPMRRASVAVSVVCDVNTNLRRGSFPQFAPMILPPCPDDDISPLRDRRQLAWLYPGAAIVVGTKTTSLNALLEKQGILKTALLDAALQKQDLTETVSLDSLLTALNVTASSNLDALLKAVGVLKTAELDAALQKPDLSRTVLLDAILAATVTLTANLDAILKAVNFVGATTDLDALLKAIGELRSLSLDAAIQLADQTRTISLDAALASLNVTKTSSLDSILKALNVERTVVLDAALALLGITKTAELDAALAQLNITSITDLDALLKAVGVTRITDLDALLKAINFVGATTNLDAALQAANLIVSLNLDAKLLALNVTRTADLDAALLTPNLSKTAVFDAVLAAGVVCDAETNKRRGSFPQYLPMVLGPCPDGDLTPVEDRRMLAGLYPSAAAAATFTRTAELDALLRALDLSVVVQLDAVLQALDLSESVALDAALVQQDQLKTMLLDAALQLSNQAETLTLDAILALAAQTIAAELDAALQALAQTRTSALDAHLGFPPTELGFKPSWSGTYGQRRMLKYIAPHRTNI